MKTCFGPVIIKMSRSGVGSLFMTSLVSWAVCGGGREGEEVWMMHIYVFCWLVFLFWPQATMGCQHDSRATGAPREGVVPHLEAELSPAAGRREANYDAI